MDAYDEDAAVLESVEEEYLPAPMQGLDAEEKKAYVQELTKNREKIKQEIQQLSAKREAIYRRAQA